MKTSLQGHYTIGEIENMAHLRANFGSKTDYELNWLFCGTSGIHGSYRTLDDLEDEDIFPASLTVLIVRPRVCVLLCGLIEVDKVDIPFIRNVVSDTLDAIESTQYPNTTHDWRSASPDRWDSEYEKRRKE